MDQWINGPMDQCNRPMGQWTNWLMDLCINQPSVLESCWVWSVVPYKQWDQLEGTIGNTKEIWPTKTRLYNHLKPSKKKWGFLGGYLRALMGAQGPRPQIRDLKSFALDVIDSEEEVGLLEWLDPLQLNFGSLKLCMGNVGGIFGCLMALVGVQGLYF